MNVYVPAEPMVGMKHQGGATAQDPVRDSLTLLLKLFEPNDGSTK